MGRSVESEGVLITRYRPWLRTPIPLCTLEDAADAKARYEAARAANKDALLAHIRALDTRTEQAGKQTRKVAA